MKEFLEQTIMQWLDKSPFYKIEETEKHELAVDLTEFILEAIDSSGLEITMLSRKENDARKK